MVGVPDAKGTDEGSKTLYGYGYANLTTTKIIAQVFASIWYIISMLFCRTFTPVFV